MGEHYDLDPTGTRERRLRERAEAAEAALAIANERWKIVADTQASEIERLIVERDEAERLPTTETEMSQDSAPVVSGALDHCYTAWMVIANVSDGDWSQQSDEWRGAAERWRDQFHKLLDAARRLPTNGDE